VEPSPSPRSAAELWASFPHDPRDPAVASLRASDADRNLVSQVLVEAFADGRLDRDEYDERAAAVLATRTLGELPPLVADLVPDRPLLPASAAGQVALVSASAADLQKMADQHWRDERRRALMGVLGSGGLLWTIWVISVVVSGHFIWPWPLIVNALALLNLIRTMANRRDIVSSELRRLEKRQAKALEARNNKPGPTD
jgi:hypothetical protein